MFAMLYVQTLNLMQVLLSAPKSYGGDLDYNLITQFVLCYLHFVEYMCLKCHYVSVSAVRSDISGTVFLLHLVFAMDMH